MAASLPGTVSRADAASERSSCAAERSQASELQVVMK